MHTHACTQTHTKSGQFGLLCFVNYHYQAIFQCAHGFTLIHLEQNSGHTKLNWRMFIGRTHKRLYKSMIICECSLYLFRTENRHALKYCNSPYFRQNDTISTFAQEQGKKVWRKLALPQWGYVTVPNSRHNLLIGSKVKGHSLFCSVNSYMDNVWYVSLNSWFSCANLYQHSNTFITYGNYEKGTNLKQTFWIVD